MYKSLVVVAFAGLIASGYLFVAYVAPTLSVCTEGGSCYIVQTSRYANMFGVPTALLGVLFYLVLGILAAFWTQQTASKLTLLLTLWTGIGFAVSVWLTYLEMFVIHAWCMWCVASAILATAAFGIVWLRPKKDLSRGLPDRVGQ